MSSINLKKVFRIIFFCLILVASVTCKKDPAISQQTSHKHLKIVVFVKDLQNPWGMAFLPNGDFLFLERNGNINLLKKGAVAHNLMMFRNVEVSEGGLLGLAIDPDFNNNHFVFIYETIVGSNQLVRLKLENDAIIEDQIILTGIPVSNNHDGGALRFGPDGYLYLGTGDATQPDLA